MSIETNYIDVTELSGDEVTQEQITRIYQRYYWAHELCRDKDVVELGCGTGQGLGLISPIAKSFVAGDYSEQILSIAQQYYRERIKLIQCDAQDMPFDDSSKDVLILFEAIYYLPDASKFINECVRVLGPGGRVLICTANPDLFDFNPSPHSYRYYGTVELVELFESKGFKVQCFGDIPIDTVSLRQKILRPIKKIVVNLNLMPKSMAGKKFLKRLVFGKLVPMPAEITSDTVQYVPPTPIPTDLPDTKHKVIYCSAVLN